MVCCFTSSLQLSTHSVTANNVVDSDNNVYREESDHAELQVPSRYIRGCGDFDEALRRWRLTLDWRHEVICYFYYCC